MKNNPRQVYKAILFVVTYLLLMGAALIAANKYLDQDTLQKIVSGTGSIGILIYSVISYIWVILVPGYNTPIHVVSGYIFGSELGWLVNFISTTAGLLTIIWLVKRFGRPLLEKFVNPNALSSYDSIINRIGPIVLFIMYVLPGFPDDEVTYLLSASPKVKFSRFILPVILGTVAKTSVSYIGSMGFAGISYNITIRLVMLIIGLGIVGTQEYYLKVAVRDKREGL